jgi:hypothetical protein
MAAQLTLQLAPSKPRAPKRRSYYDTTRIPLTELAQAARRAEMQDDAVLAVFRAHLVMAPARCLEQLHAAGVPILITSVRRSISSLTSAGVLRKSPETVPGPYGAKEHLWELVEQKGGKLHAAELAA